MRSNETSILSKFVIKSNHQSSDVEVRQIDVAGRRISFLKPDESAKDTSLTNTFISSRQLGTMKENGDVKSPTRHSVFDLAAYKPSKPKLHDPKVPFGSKKRKSYFDESFYRQSGDE